MVQCRTLEASRVFVFLIRIDTKYLSKVADTHEDFFNNKFLKNLHLTPDEYLWQQWQLTQNSGVKYRYLL